MCEAFFGMVDVACADAQEVATQLECVPPSWIQYRNWWAKRGVTFPLDGASNLGVRGANAQQVVEVSIIENNMFALIGRWLVLMTRLSEPCHVLHASWVMHWRLLAHPMLITRQLWIAG